MGILWEDLIWGPEKPPRSPADSGDKSCCFGAAAVKSARQGRWRLARRYAVRCVRALAVS
jgi:hypothetical protein